MTGRIFVRYGRSLRLLSGTAGFVAIVVALAILFGRRSGDGVSAHQHGRVKEMPGVIRGAVTPDVIPDEAAYSILFRMLARGDASTPARYRQNAAYVKFRMGITGGDCLSPAAYPASATLPPVNFASDKTSRTSCPEGTRFVTYHERLVLLARRYVSAIEVPESQAKAAVLAAARNQPIASSASASLQARRREALSSVVADLDGALGANVAGQVRRFAAIEMKNKMAMRLVEGGMVR